MSKIPIDLQTGSISSPQNSSPIIGIDLGTTNSIVAVVIEGEPKAISGLDGSSAIMPSLLHFHNDGSLAVGDAARKGLLDAPQRTIYSVKRLLGKSYQDIAEKQHHFSYDILEEDTDELVKIRMADRFYSPIELSAEILRVLKQRVEQYLETAVEKAVITVPAYFNDTQRQATRDAGKIAGLDVLRIVNEPTAASLAYGISQTSHEGETIAVYDLGGGTFDISILSISDGVFDVLATAGDTYLGGDDFDLCIVQYWLNDMEEEEQSSFSDLRQRLRIEAEKAKKHLSKEYEFLTQIGDRQFSIDRPTFESLIKEKVDRTITLCQRALRDADVDIQAIDHVVLVGGSTRVPAVKDAIRKLFEKEPNDSLDPDIVVALGAAIQADILAGNQKDILLLDVTPLSLGIETVGGLMDVIVPRNTKVPTRVGRQYTTSVDGQKNLKVAVFQGERDLVEHNRKLAEFILRDIPPMPAGLPKIEIQFIIDADGILQVKAKELRSERTTSIEVRPTYGITEEQMAQMLKDSIEHAKDDMKAKARIEAQTEGRNIVLATRKFIKQNKSQLKKDEILHLQKLNETLAQYIEKGDKDSIEKAMHELNEYAKPFAQKVMDHIISDAMTGKTIQDE